MKHIVLLSGALYGGLSVVLGAFGAHALKKILSAEALESFKTGVSYQMYHALALLLIGVLFDFSTRMQNYMAWAYIVGIFLFSFSIYMLTLLPLAHISVKIFGPLTPLGGLLLVVGWGLLVFNILQK